MSIAPLHRDTDGSKPLIPPHILQFILQPPRPEQPEPKRKEDDAWSAIDRLEAAR